MLVNLSVDLGYSECRYGGGMDVVTTSLSPPERSPVLRVLRVGLHAMFAGLLTLGLVRAFFPSGVMSASPMHELLLMTFLAAVLALIYVLGTSREYRWYRHDAKPDQRRAKFLGSVWLGAITALWLLLMLLSPTFVWVAFPLMFLYLYFLGTAAGVVAVVLLWAATWLLPWWDTVRAIGPQSPDVATIVGPGIGAVLAVLISAAYRHLVAQAAHHQRVAAALQAAQSDLAAFEHRAGQLEERERLAREIHDTLAQGFSSIVLISRAVRQSQELSASSQQSLELIEETAAVNLTEARGLVQHLGVTDPADSLRTQLERLTKRYETELAVRQQPVDMHLRWEGEESPDPLPSRISAAVLRIVQVGLGNAAAHAQATQVVVTVGIWNDELTVDVFDNGIGFTVPEDFYPGFRAAPEQNTDAETTGYGLYGLRQRLAALNGILVVESTPGEGTVVAARIPLTSASPIPTGQEDR